MGRQTRAQQRVVVKCCCVVRNSTVVKCCCAVRKKCGRNFVIAKKNREKNVRKFCGDRQIGNVLKTSQTNLKRLGQIRNVLNRTSISEKTFGNCVETDEIGNVLKTSRTNLKRLGQFRNVLDRTWTWTSIRKKEQNWVLQVGNFNFKSETETVGDSTSI